MSSKSVKSEDIFSEFEVGGINYGEELVSDLDFGMDVEKELRRQPNLFAKWAIRSEVTKATVVVLKTKLDLLYAKLDFDVRKMFEKEEKKVTEKRIETEILLNIEYQGLLEKYNVAKLDSALASVGEKSIVQKKDILLQLSDNSNK